MLSSCQPAPSHLLEKAMQMENVSTDSIFFYLQQIEEPDKLPLNDQGDYYLLLYKATLWKTGTPDDSLLQIAIRQYKQNEQQTQYVRARIEQSASYLYRNLPDSAQTEWSVYPASHPAVESSPYESYPDQDRPRHQPNSADNRYSTDR